ERYQEGHVGVAASAGPHRRLGARGAGDPDGRMWLLQWQAPGVHVAEVVVPAFPAKRPGIRPALQDQIVAFLEALAVVYGVRVGPPGLHAHAAHEAREHAPARDEVRHRELFGHAYRVVLDRQDVAEQQDLRLPRRTAEHRGGHVHADVHARRRRVVLVDHET